jgi:hypothetical protein
MVCNGRLSNNAAVSRRYEVCELLLLLVALFLSILYHIVDALVKLAVVVVY